MPFFLAYSKLNVHTTQFYLFVLIVHKNALKMKQTFFGHKCPKISPFLKNVFINFKNMFTKYVLKTHLKKRVFLKMKIVSLLFAIYAV